MKNNGKNDILDAFKDTTNAIDMLVPYGIKTAGGVTDWLSDELDITWNQAADGTIDFANDNALMTVTESGQLRGFRVVTSAAFSGSLPAYSAEVGIDIPVDYKDVQAGDKLKILEVILGLVS